MAMSETPKYRTGSLGGRSDDQSEVIAFLADPDSHGPTVKTVERIETHGALIFLAGEHVYKLKRAVKLAYLDFTTLAQRAGACQHEIERNKAAAPNLYIAAVAIARSADGKLTIGGDGEPVDWVVVMNRFDQSDLFDNLAAEGKLAKELMLPLAEVIADYHDDAQVFRALDGHDILARVVTQTVMTFFEAGELLEFGQVNHYSGRVVAELNARSQLLRSRAHHGYVRLCHGDLHLGNIVLSDGKPTLFDAIEFDDTIARIDVLYDLAFLLMDLWHRGLKKHANLCFNNYVSKAMQIDALSGLAALPLFLSARAAIRAMVAIDKAAVAELEDETKTRKDIAGYFDLACEFLNTEEPVLIAIGGLSGTGKTTLAAALAPTIGHAPGALHLRSDVERKRMVGVDPLERLPPHAYSQSASAKVYKRLCDRAEQALEAGHSVIVDATFIEAADRRQIERVAAKSRVRFIGLWLEASGDQLVNRVTQRKGDASDADAAVVLSQLSVRSINTCWETVDAGVKFETVLSRANFTLKTKAYRRR